MTRCIANKIYYLTTDLDNAEEARRLALKAGIDLEVLFPKDLPVPADGGALLVDLDYLCLDAHGRRQFVKEMPSLCPEGTVGAHSYDFDAVRPEQEPTGPVARRLSVQLLRALFLPPEEMHSAA
jgi:hypothetical protein